MPSPHSHALHKGQRVTNNLNGTHRRTCWHLWSRKCWQECMCLHLPPLGFSFQKAIKGCNQDWQGWSFKCCEGRKGGACHPTLQYTWLRTYKLFSPRPLFFLPQYPICLLQGIRCKITSHLYAPFLSSSSVTLLCPINYCATRLLVRKSFFRCGRRPNIVIEWLLLKYSTPMRINEENCIEMKLISVSTFPHWLQSFNAYI